MVEKIVTSASAGTRVPGRENEVFVDSPAAFNGLIQRIEKSKSVAIDTEGDSLHSYFEKLCLIQISVPGLDAIVDPLAGLDLVPLLRAAESRRLILHGADFDLRMLRRIGEYHPVEIFDTVIAARLTGHVEFSLAALVKEYFGVVLSKGSQKANWGRRPLSPVMLEYAHNDTRYLVDLTARLEERLIALGRLDWCRQTCQRLAEQVLSSSGSEHRERWRIKGWASTRGIETVVLRALWHWREEEAKAIDRPAFHILRNEDLLRAAKEMSTGAPLPFHHLSAGKRRRMQQAVTDALALPESEWPKKEPSQAKRMTAEQERRVDQLKAHRDKKAAELNLDPSFIAPRTTLERIVVEESDGALLPWQRAVLFGEA